MRTYVTAEHASIASTVSILRRLAMMMNVSIRMIGSGTLSQYKTMQNILSSRPPLRSEDIVIHDPFLIPGMDRAVSRIKYANAIGEKTLIYGDYDADGVCSTAILASTLESVGMNVYTFFPDRRIHGYGLNSSVIRYAHTCGVNLIIAVDCGITAINEAALAKTLGIDMIICDHHKPLDTLPDAIICSSKPGAYPFPDICASVVAGKVAQAVGGEYGEYHHCLEAIGTIADCMPMICENRAIVIRGLEALRNTRHPGISALMQRMNIRREDLSSEDVAFKIAPAINAPGRIGDSRVAYNLLRSVGIDAELRAETVFRKNILRKEVSQQIFLEADTNVQKQNHSSIIVVSGTGWNAGVSGIVASKLVEKYGKPAIVLSDNGIYATGSARSIEGVSIYDALQYSSDLLQRFGGHEAAAGLSLESKNIDEFRILINEYDSSQIVVPSSLAYDAIIERGEEVIELAEEIELLQPFGEGWRNPILLVQYDNIIDVTRIGADKNHLRMGAVCGNKVIQCVWFGAGDDAEAVSSSRRDLLVNMSINKWRGRSTLQYIVRGYA